MGQILVKEKIADLSITGAKTLELPASIMNIGGQQFRTITVTTLDLTVSGVGGLDTGALANDTYFVYAVRDSSLTKLVASLNDEDTGPTGFAAWRLLGALETDATPDIEVVISTPAPSLVKKTESFAIGSIQQSVLDLIDFQAEMGSTDWVLCDGSNITGSALATYIGNTLPDATGRFLRTAGGNAAAMRVQQADEAKAHNHNLSLDDWGTSEQSTTVSSMNFGNAAAATGVPRAVILVNDVRATTEAVKGILDSVDLRNPTMGVAATTTVEGRPVNITVNTFIKIN